MNEDKKTKVDANSREFSRGVEAGLHAKDTKYWQAGYELGQELSGTNPDSPVNPPITGDRDTKELVKENVQTESDSPLFLKDTLDGHKGDAQDEKDKSAE